MTSLNEYSQGTVNWRDSLKKNNQKTLFLIAIFFLVYLGLGLLVDLYISSLVYPYVPLPVLLKALLTFQLLPIATLVMLGVASLSIFVAFTFHDRLMLLGTEYREITPKTAASDKEQQLYHLVEEMKIAAGLQFMPRVFIIEADYMNAFASGYSEKSALIAITRALIMRLNRNELQAVIAHELSHIRHMDIKLTLMASVLANLMVMILDLLFYNALYSRHASRDREGNGALLAVIMTLRYLLPLINIFLLLYLSRTREYMADAGSVELMRDNQPLASALLKIQQNYQTQKEGYEASPHENIRREAYIFDPVQAGFKEANTLSDLFSTHPSLADRLKALGFQQK